MGAFVVPKGSAAIVLGYKGESGAVYHRRECLYVGGIGRVATS